MKYVELTIVGFTNLNNFYESLDHSKIEDYDDYCDHREEDQEKNIYEVQYTIAD